MARAPAVLGIVGGAIGLATSAFGFFLSLVLTAFTLGGASFLVLPMLLDGLGAIVGITGGALSLKRPKEGGGLILAGVAVGLAGWTLSMTEAIGKGVQASSYLLLMMTFFLWWAVLMIIGGLLGVGRRYLPNRATASRAESRSGWDGPATLGTEPQRTREPPLG